MNGVQTCALPISPPRHSVRRQTPWRISSPVLLGTKRTFPRMGQNLGLAGKRKINRSEKCRKPKKSSRFPRKSRGLWLRGPDLNRRPSGYEPDELPDCSTPRYKIGAGDRGRTGTGSLPRDFKSRASANSATPACSVLAYDSTIFRRCQPPFPGGACLFLREAAEGAAIFLCVCPVAI